MFFVFSTHSNCRQGGDDMGRVYSPKYHETPPPPPDLVLFCVLLFWDRFCFPLTKQTIYVCWVLVPAKELDIFSANAHVC